MGMVFVQAMARHRLDRVPYVGITRAALESLRLQRRESHRTGLPIEAVRVVADEYAARRAGQGVVRIGG